MFFSVVTKNLIWEILIQNLTGLRMKNLNMEVHLTGLRMKNLNMEVHLTGLRMKNLNMEVHCKIRSLGSFHEI